MVVAMAGQVAEIPVYICDRQVLMCQGLAAILSREPGISVSGFSSSVDDAISAAKRQRAMVMVIGHEPPVYDGIDLVKRLGELGAARPQSILLIESSCLNQVLQPALQAGVLGVLLKDEAPNLLASSIRTVAEGAVVLASSITELVSQWSEAGERSHAAERMLSGRERDVLKLVGAGLSNDEVAVALSVSVPTVKSHLRSVFRKFDLRDRAQAVILAYESGLVRTGREGSDRLLKGALGISR
jgi:DNA-binding NarL/FixJ family response regulator